MVETIKLFQGQDIKARENKTSTRNADSKKDPKGIGRQADTTSRDAEVVSFGTGGAASAIGSQIASSNTNAAQINIISTKDADDMLRQLTEMIRKNPDLAESAQANIPSQIILNLFEKA
jgi:shikimate 5-dehydrogenase